MSSSDADTVVIRDGLTKVIKKQGDQAGGKPKANDLIFCHYVGTLEDGTVFDSSRAGGRRAFQFNLGQSQVILAWDLGIASMHLNELAVFTCAPDYAYGKNGAGGVIPPNATLTFEVELLHFGEDDRKPISNLVLVPACAFLLFLGYLMFLAQGSD